jgi:23S rRNA pseudouridine1911/1915/1917 synthase
VSRKSQTITLFYNDDYFLIADKPSGIAVIPERFKSDKLDFKQLLEKQLGISLFTVHRIDRDTSGLVVFAKTAMRN